MLFAAVEPLDGLLKRDLLQPLLIGIARVADLIHHAGALAAVAVHRVIEGDGVAYRLHREHDLLPRYAELLGDSFNAWFAPVGGGQTLLGLKHLIGGVAHRARDTDGAVVAQEAPQFTGDHRHTVGRKLHILAQVEAVHGLDEPDAADLKQIVHTLAAPGKLLDDRQNQPQVSRDQLLARGLVPAAGALEQRACLGGFQHREPCRVDSAYLYLALYNRHSFLSGGRIRARPRVWLLFPVLGNLIRGLCSAPPCGILMPVWSDSVRPIPAMER